MSPDLYYPPQVPPGEPSRRGSIRGVAGEAVAELMALFSSLRIRGVTIAEVRKDILHHEAIFLIMETKLCQVLQNQVVASDVITKRLGLDCSCTPNLARRGSQHLSLLTSGTKGILRTMRKEMLGREW